MTAPAEVAEAQSAATDAVDDLVHLPRCGDGDTAMCGADLTGGDWCWAGMDCVVCEELDKSFPCICEPGCSCCDSPHIAGAEPSLVIFDEIHYFTGGAA